jgi:hypothetical protein
LRDRFAFGVVDGVGDVAVRVFRLGFFAESVVAVGGDRPHLRGGRPGVSALTAGATVTAGWPASS